MSNITISDIIMTPETQSFCDELEEQEIGDILGGDCDSIEVSYFWGLITVTIEVCDCK